MSFLAVLFLALGGALAVAAFWLLGVTRHKEKAALDSLADRRGWDHQAGGPEDLAQLAARVLPPESGMPTGRLDLHDHFSGPTPVGPFRLGRVRMPPNGLPPTHREATLVHIRTPLSSPGIHARPAARFRAAGSQGEAAIDGDRFSRFYHATGDDPVFFAHALDPATRAFIAAPRRTIRFDWQERDLVIAFPFAARTPHAVEALVAWSAAVAGRLNESPYRESPRASSATSRVSAASPQHPPAANPT